MAGLFYWCYMAIDERGVNLRITADAEGVKKGTEEAKKAIRGMADDFEREGKRSSKGIDLPGKQSEETTKKVERSTKSMIASIQRQTAVLEAGSRTNAKYWETLASQRGVDPNVLKPYLDQLDSVRAKQSIASSALAGGAIQFDKYGMSAKQTAAAMRGVPAQLTDIFVSIQGGQRPMTVLLQQGGQLKDMFGGIVPAARALATGVMAMVNPFTLAAAAVGAIYMAYSAGASESEAFNKTLLMTGNVAGVSGDQLMSMAKQIDGVAGTQRNAAAALNEFAKSGKVASTNLQDFATAAIRWEQATGTAVADTVKHFEELGKDPLKASLKLNESMGYLTASVYEQIQALIAQGKETEAAAVAQKAFADSLDDRAPKMLENLGFIERGWLAIKKAIAETIDEALEFGRSQTLQERLSKELKKLEEMERLRNIGSIDLFGSYAAQKQTVDSLQEQINLQQKLIGYEGERHRALKAAQDLDSYLGDNSRMSRAKQMEKDIAKEKSLYADRVADAKGNAETLQKLEAAHQTALKNIKEKYKDKKESGGISTTKTELAGLLAQIEAEKQRATQLEASAGALAKLNDGEKLALQYSEKIKLATKAGTIAELERNKALATQYGAMKRKNDEFEKEAKLQADTIAKVKAQTLGLEDQIATYGLGKSAIEAMIIARLEEKRAALEGKEGNDAIIQGINDEIAARKQLAEAMAGKEALDQQKKEWEAWEREVGKIFDRVGQSLTDAIFEGGKSAKDLLKDIFKGLTFNVLINPMMKGMQGWVTNEIGGLMGYQNPAQQGSSGMPNMPFGGGSIANGIGKLGEQFGSTAIQSFAQGMAGTAATFGQSFALSALPATASWAGAAAGLTSAAVPTISSTMAMGSGMAASMGTGIAGTVGAGTAAAAAAPGLAGLGATIGAAMPYIGVALAAASAFGLFDEGPPKTRHGQRTTIDYTGGAFGVAGIDDRQAAGSEAAALAAAQSSVLAANEAFAKLGVNAAIENFYAVMESSVLGDRDGVGSGGTLRVGDQMRQIGLAQASDMTFGGFGGWSSAEMLPRLQTDIQMSILEAFQAVGDDLPSALSDMLDGVWLRGLDSAGAQELAARFSAIIDGATQFLTAIEALPFEQLRGLSFDAAAGLVQLAGGVENLLGAQQTYYQAYYSEAERHGIAVGNLTSALAAAGVVMPELIGSTEQMLASYRAQVEAQDLNTEAGRQAYVALMQASGAFAEVATYAGQVTGALDSVADIMRERQGLELQALQLQGNTAEIRRRELAALDESNHALQRYVWALQDQQSAFDAAAAVGESAFSALSRSVSAEKSRLQKESQAIADALRNSISAASTTVNELTSLTGRLTSTVQRMIGQGLDEGRNRAWAQDRIDRALSVAKLTGVMPQGADFESALSIVAEPSEGLFSSFEDYQADFLKTAHTISSLNELADGQLSTEKRALRALEDQLTQSQEWYRAEMERLDATLEYWRQQLDIANGTYQVELSQLDAINGVIAAIGALAAVNKPAVGGVGTGGGGGLSREAAYLANNPDVAAAYAQYGADWGVSATQFVHDHYANFGKDEGRSFAVGTGYVPHDMMANIHRGEIIIDPRSSDVLRRYGINVQGGGASSRQVEQELREMRLMLKTLLEEGNRNTASLDRTNRQMVEQPTPVTVTNIVPTVAVTPGS